jgi:hypothetical protein
MEDYINKAGIYIYIYIYIYSNVNTQFKSFGHERTSVLVSEQY